MFISKRKFNKLIADGQYLVVLKNGETKIVDGKTFVKLKPDNIKSFKVIIKIWLIFFQFHFTVMAYYTVESL